ncbi:GNAT family N-acetyltransferase [Kibdelosporangium persicum]|uniref:Ribosomal-protein-alanine acetyltransferase n=1 Tax=Kibdelosporangium persicum TaxID=2698649 RepID=A0ABX2FFG7_9PSEU|nr:GNAT family N-acetyltransferase [Kibdelosporangium persicum]NRN70134.1 Ribosomal-protein-alanine acetyltransferase [Kibdelosporangium persicum]
MTKYTLRPIETADQSRIGELLTESWGSPRVVAGHGRVHDAAKLPGLVASQDGQVVGLLTYYIEGRTAELVTLNAYRADGGIGTALLEAMTSIVKQLGCERIILMTTNDNTDAIRFYQRRGFRFRELRVGAIDAARQLKPEIPEIGEHGIPIRDELELELLL